MNIYHLYLKAKQEHHFFNSIPFLFETQARQGNELGVSRFTIERWDFKKEYENNLITLRKGELQARKNKPRGATKKPGG